MGGAEGKEEGVGGGGVHDMQRRLIPNALSFFVQTYVSHPCEHGGLEEGGGEIP